MNGYFQVLIDEMGVKLKLVPQTNGGAPISIKELTTYLDREKIPFDLKALNNELLSLKDQAKILFMSDQKRLPVSESCVITVSFDKMSAIARFYPASETGKKYDKEGIKSELRIAKVAYGVDDAAIDSFLANKQYCTDYVLAVGTPVVEGKDAFITYKFETDNKIKPTVNEDGSVDFFNLNVVTHCKAGDLLAVLTKEDKGQDGKDVLGNNLKPREVKRLTLSYGLNIDINEERTEIYSKVNGHVSLVNGKVFVADVLEVENVDNSTGNIDYEGNVKINGNVSTNFVVKAKGNIEVRGVVEGAFLEAEGNIILSRGINGMNRGVLKAGGNIVTKFLENCKAYSGGNVETESIVHSTVQAKNEINVIGRKGFITGGSVSATDSIKVKTLGSPMGAATEVTVGVDPTVTNRYQELAKEIQESQKNLKVFVPVLDATKQKLAQGVKLLPEQVKNLQTLAINVKALQEKIKTDMAEMETLKELMDSSSNARVEVTGEVFAGTTISISDVSMVIKESLSYCKFVKEQGTVKMKPL